MRSVIPNSFRYVKNGRGGRWWETAKNQGQIHAGWREVPHDLLRTADMTAIEPLIRAEFATKTRATIDLHALRTLLDHPSQHVWITFEDGCMWWCTVGDGIEPNASLPPSSKMLTPKCRPRDFRVRARAN
jgi:hypothetical protein